jgi:hypothetical protein
MSGRNRKEEFQVAKSRSDSSVLVPGAPTIEAITRKMKGGGFAIGHDGTFGPISGASKGIQSAFGEDSTDTRQKHRRWTPTRVVGEIATVQMVSEMEMKGRLTDEFLKDALVADLDATVGEMITTSQGAMDLLEKVRLDIDVGLADVPLLYQPLFERIDGPFPGGSVQIGGDVLFDANVVFQQKFEAGEIIFGTLARTGAPTFVPIQTYAAGFEWTEDMIEFDRSYEIGMNARAFGRAYNYLLNHLHLSPIIAFTYGGGNSTAAVSGNGSLQANTLVGFQNAYRTAALAVPQRVPTWILANEADRFQIEDALLTPVIDGNGNPMRRVPVEGIIYYNGATLTNGVKNYTYPGVTAGTCYFITPRLRMKELVHHDLRVDVGPADISRLVEGQQVARTRRGAYMDIANSVQKVTLATSST